MTCVMGVALTDTSNGSRMATDGQSGRQTERTSAISAGIMEGVGYAMLLAPITLLVGMLLFLLVRRYIN